MPLTGATALLTRLRTEAPWSGTPTQTPDCLHLLWTQSLTRSCPGISDPVDQPPGPAR